MVGKTTLLDSIAWTLYGYLPKWGGPKGGPADAVIKRGEDKCSATVFIEHAGDTYEITRQRPVKLTVKKNGEIQEGKTADLDKRIPVMIGMTDSQFLLSVYMPQKRSSSFFNMSDTDRTELLSKVAGLEELDTALNRVKSKRSETYLEVENIKGRVSAMEMMLSRLPEEKEEFTDKVRKALAALDVSVTNLNEIEKPTLDDIVKIESERNQELQGIALTVDEAISAHDTNIRILKQQYQELNNEISSAPRVPAELFNRVEQLRGVLSEREEDNRKRLAKIATNERLQAKMLLELDQMEAASQGKCNHCKQDLPSWDKEQASLRHMQNAKKFESEMLTIGEEIDLAPFRLQVEEAVLALNTAKNQLAERPLQLKIEMDSVMRGMKSEQEIIDIKRSSGIKERESINTTAESKISKLKQLLKDAKSLVTLNEKYVDESLEALKRLTSREESDTAIFNENKIKLAAAQAEIDELMDLMDLFGPKGFRTVCFEDLISRISDRAGQLLSVMTEGLYSTRIEQAGETGKGEHRVMLRPVITRGGLEVPSDDLSGGAEATVTLNYDVAISEAIAENSPLFLDEALDGLDAIGKAEAIRLLEEVARTRPVFLIDHTDSIKSSVQNIIQITYKNDTSTLEGSDEIPSPVSSIG